MAVVYCSVEDTSVKVEVMDFVMRKDFVSWDRSTYLSEHEVDSPVISGVPCVVPSLHHDRSDMGVLVDRVLR